MQAIDKYKPQVPSIFDEFKVDQTLSREDYAFEIWKKLLTAKKAHEALFLVIGSILKEIRDKKIYKTLDYENFSQFLASEEVSYSKEAAYIYIRVYEFYVEYLKMSEDKIGSINLSRLSMMIPVLKKIEDRDEIISKINELNTLRYNDFVHEIKKEKKTAKPSVYFSESLDLWIVEYFDNKTKLMSLGNYEDQH